MSLPVSRSDAPGGEPERPCFYLDPAAPESYLVAERILATVPVATEWVPVQAAALPAGTGAEGFRCAEEESIWRADLERRAAARGLQPLRWPPAVPFDSGAVLRAATFAKGIGKGVAFCLAALRQAYAGGADLERREAILIAAAACEMHPRAVLAALGQRTVAAGLERATDLARERGVRAAPAVWVPAPTGGRAFHGDDALDAAAAFMAEHAAG